VATIERFEDLECWQKARELCKIIYEFTREKEFTKDFTLVNQIRAASGSAMDNPAEGFGRGGNKEFIQFLSIGCGSASEVKSQLYRALDQRYINHKEFAYNLADQVGRLIMGLIKYLRNSEIKGSKFKKN
jgi:four helix bundle protein